MPGGSIETKHFFGCEHAQPRCNEVGSTIAGRAHEYTGVGFLGEQLSDRLDDGHRLSCPRATHYDIERVAIRKVRHTHGPNTMNVGEPGGWLIIDVTPCNCLGFVAMRRLKRLSRSVDTERTSGSMTSLLVGKRSLAEWKAVSKA